MEIDSELPVVGSVSIAEVYQEVELDKDRRAEFRKGLLHSVFGLKSFVSSINEDFKGLRMRPGAATQILAGIDRKRKETSKLLEEVKDSFGQVAAHLKDELLGLRMELSESRDSIQDIVGFDDFVRGFDGELVIDENIDFLDIYAQFLG